LRVKDLDDQWLLKTHFFGIYKKKNDRLVLENPNVADDIFEPSVIRDEIQAAIGRVQKLINADIKLKEHIVEYHDYNMDDAMQYFYVQPRHYPVITVHSMKLKYGEQGAEILEFPSEYIQIKPGTNDGLIQVLPRLGSAMTLSMDPGLAFFVGMFDSYSAPSMIELEYDAGLEGLPDELDADMTKVIGMLASIHLFNVWGDIIIAPGVANFSMGFDGISTSIGTTLSAENAAFSARVREYERELYGQSMTGVPGLISTLVKKYQRIIVGTL